MSDPTPNLDHPLLRSAHALQATWLAAVAAIRAAHQARAGLAHDGLLDHWDTHVELARLHGDFVAHLRVKLIAHLETQGTPAAVELPRGTGWEEGAPSYRAFDGNHDAFFGAELDHAATRSFPALAQSLLDAYTPERARAASLHEAAQRVHRYFVPWHRPAVAIVERGGRRIMSRAIYGGDRWRLGRDERAALAHLLEDMRLLLRESGRDGALAAPESLAADPLFDTGSYHSRLRVEIGPGLCLVFFKDRLEFHFTPATLEALQVAIAAHRPSHEAA